MAETSLTPAASAAPLNPPVTVTLGSLRTVSEVAYWIALDRGYFKDEGIDLQVETFNNPGDIIPQMATGRVDVANAPPDPSTYNAIASGIAVRFTASHSILATGNAIGGFMVRQDLLDSGRYKGPQDLKGMTIAIAQQGTFQQLLLDRFLAQGGLTEDDIKLTTLALTDNAAAFSNKAIDAAQIIEPFVTIIQGQKLASTVEPNGDLISGPLILQMMGPNLIQRPNVANHLEAAFVRGNRDYWNAVQRNGSEKAAIFAIMAKYSTITDPNTLDVMVSHNGLPSVDPNSEMDEQALAPLQDYFLKAGTQKTRLDLASVMDRSFLNNALQRLGRVSG